MRLLLFICLLHQYTTSAQSHIWILGNERLYTSQVETILQHGDYSRDDVLIFHGNAIKDSDKKSINLRIKELRDQFDRVYIVPGNEEWSSLRADRLKDLGDYLDDEFKGDVIVPENSCGAIEVKEVGGDMALVFIDSEWYFSDWHDDENFNKGCEIYSREKFWIELQDEIGGLKAKRIILIARHPIWRYDALGGHYSMQEHLFPLTKWVPGAYIPLPIIGTAIADTRSYLTPRQSSMSTLYLEYTVGIKGLIKDHQQITTISSHAKYNSVSSYRGCTQVNVNSHEDSDKLSDKYIDYADQSPMILSVSVEEYPTITFIDRDGQESWSRILAQDNQYTDETKRKYTPVDPDQMITRPIRLEKDFVDLNNTIFGSLNKRYYRLEVTLPQLNLSSHLGGLSPVRLGGGKQTVSLRLRDSTDHIYLARSLKKDPEKTLPITLRIEPAENVIENYYMAANPLGFLVAAPLESAANVLHNTPRLMYLPKQEALRPYNDEIGDEIVLFRERADGDWSEKESFGYSDDIMSSNNMLNHLRDYDGVVDAEMYLRARLVDYMINDWDRHADQWRWAEVKEGEQTIYKPIPRDRDQVFSTFDGWVINLLKPYSVDFIQLRNWDDHLSKKDVRWMHFKSAYLDNMILHQLNKDQWQRETAFVKNVLTEDVVNTAVAKLPPSFAEGKESIRTNILARIEELTQTSQYLREEVKDRVLVQGTDKEDNINITIYNDSLRIVISHSDNREVYTSYDQYVYEDETDELWIYGLDDDDDIMVRGDHIDIDLVIIGGYGEDAYKNKSDTDITIVDDQKEVKTKRSHYRYTTNKEIHGLDRFDLTPQHRYMLPTLSYNTDDGLGLGAAYVWNNTGFKSSNQHTLAASYLTERQSSSVSYRYQHTDQLNGMTKFLEAYYSGIQRQMNYYGGNDSSDDFGNDYYDVIISDMRLDLGVSKTINRVSQITGNIYGWSVRAEDRANTFITEEAEVDTEIFKRNHFLGMTLQLDMANFDKRFRPAKGARIHLSADARYMPDTERTNLTLTLEYDYYKSMLYDDRLIFSSKVRLGHIIGDYFIYEGFQVGGADVLRGYANGRFTGRTQFAQNTNVHLKLFNKIMPTFFPSSFGVTGSFDHGRVWSDLDVSDSWQYSYGAGLWLSPIDAFVLSAGYHLSDEDAQVRVRFGWQF